jgi:hypothetical protein
MMRDCWALLVLLATTGASPPSMLPVPPIPPAYPPTGQSAPMPDVDAQAPLADTEAGAQLSLRDFRVQRFYQGLGYAPGSRFETSEDKRPIQTPGVTVTVPLH